MSLTIGDTVGDYRVVGILGAGGMGAVYQVQHLISDRLEAMKVLLPDLQGSSELAERFLREIKLQATLTHPGIAALHNALRQDNQLLMIMEYVEGDSLDAILRNQKLDLWAGAEIIQQVLSALGYAHRQGVVHRDIKPANIMVTPDGRVKLMDFGIARPSGNKRLTQTGAAVGSLYYMSPEQVRGENVDSRSDLYSVGITLYEIATGRRPFRGDSSYSVMNAHLLETPRAPDALNPEIPVVLSLAILRALQKDPAERYQTADEFSAMLEDLRRRYDKNRPITRRIRSRDWAQTVAAPAHPAGTPAPSAPAVTPSYSAPSAAAAATPPTPTPAAPQAPTPAPSSTPVPALFDSDGLERLKIELAACIGPVAKLLVDRKAKKASSWKQLYEMLAEELPSGREREKFLAAHRGGH